MVGSVGAQSDRSGSMYEAVGTLRVLMHESDVVRVMVAAVASFTGAGALVHATRSTPALRVLTGILLAIILSHGVMTWS